MDSIVRVGVGILLVNNQGQVLIGRRKGSHGEGTYSAPGGHQEFGETYEETAIRELKEETNLDAYTTDIMEVFFTDDFMITDNKHYITLLPVITKFTGSLKNMEPHKLEKWMWLDWSEVKQLGDKLFLPMQNFIKKYPDFDPSNI